jgi:hypothetical protein
MEFVVRMTLLLTPPTPVRPAGAFISVWPSLGTVKMRAHFLFQAADQPTNQPTTLAVITRETLPCLQESLGRLSFRLYTAKHGRLQLSALWNMRLVRIRFLRTENTRRLRNCNAPFENSQSQETHKECPISKEKNNSLLYENGCFLGHQFLLGWHSSKYVKCEVLKFIRMDMDSQPLGPKPAFGLHVDSRLRYVFRRLV